MSLLCACCDCYTLKIKYAVEIYPDQNYDECSVQVVKCSNCQFEGIAIYEESRRGSLDSESFSHLAYKVPASKIELFYFLIDNNLDIDLRKLITSDENGKKYDSFHIKFF